MDRLLYKQFLLSVIPTARVASGGKEINCRCFECPDGRDPKSAHMYISIPDENDNKPSMFYCMKCGAAGIVDHTTLIKWGIYDSDIAIVLTEYNNSIKGKPTSSRYFTPKSYHISNSYTTINDKSEEKRRYIVERLGVDLSYQDLNNLKICLNLIDLLEENNVQKLTRNRNIIDQLDREFVGFISVDNAFLNMRRTCPEGIVIKDIDKRYINYKIYDKYDTSERFYTIPTQIDLLSKERIKFHIAEGPFDILSIYLNVRNKEPGIYTAAAGNNYINIIMYFLSKIQLPFIELHFYPDNDKFGTIDRIKNIMSRIPDKTIPVYIHKNIYEGEKDFGVPKDRIIESSMKIQ